MYNIYIQIQIKNDNDPHKNDDDNKLADLDYLSPFIIKYVKYIIIKMTLIY